MGYVAKNNYLLKTLEPAVDSLYSQNLEDFFVVENKKQFTQAEEVLIDRVNSFHINNGVEIRKPKSVYIEPEVDIEKGVVIFPGNVLKGHTVIGKDVILKENNVIENSTLSEQCCVSGSVITDSVLDCGVYVSAFCDINKSKIGKNSLIESHCTIKKQRIKKETKIPSGSILGETNDSNSGIGKSR